MSWNKRPALVRGKETLRLLVISLSDISVSLLSLSAFSTVEWAGISAAAGGAWEVSPFVNWRRWISREI